jgi:hypothetical protein
VARSVSFRRHVTGDRVVPNGAGQISILGNSLAGYGYVETSHGRRVVLTILVGNVPIPRPKNSTLSWPTRRR